MDITALIQALTDAGASLATIIVLAFLLYQQNKTVKSLGELIGKNTEAIHSLKESQDKVITAVDKICDKVNNNHNG